MRYFRHPTTSVWGKESGEHEGESDEQDVQVLRWDILIRQLTGGNFFLGLAGVTLKNISTSSWKRIMLFTACCFALWCAHALSHTLARQRCP